MSTRRNALRGTNNPQRGGGRNSSGQPRKTGRSSDRILLTLEDLRRVEVRLPKQFYQTGYSVVVALSATGNQVGLSKGIPPLQPLDDAIRLYAAQNIITGKERLDKKVEKTASVKDAIIKMIVREIIKTGVPENFKSEYVKIDGLRSNLEENARLISGNSCTELSSQSAKAVLLRACAQIGKTWEKYLQAVAQKDKRSLNDMLMSDGVSKYLYSRLTGSKLPITPTSNLGRIFYPVKANTGFRMTVEEWRNPNVLHLHNGVLGNSDFIQLVTQTDELLRVVCNTPHLENFDDQSNLDVKRILEFPLYAIPTLPHEEYVKTVRDLPDLRVVGNITNENLERFGISLFRIYNLIPPSTLTAKEWILLHQGEKELKYDPKSSLRPREQLMSAYVWEEGKDLILQNLDAETKHQDQALLLFEAHFRPSGHLQKPFQELIAKPQLLKKWEMRFPTLSEKYERSYLFDQPTAAEREAVKTNPIMGEVRTPKPKERRVLPAAPLTRNALNFLKVLPKEFEGLKGSIQSYLQGFTDPAIMDIAVVSMRARLTQEIESEEEEEFLEQSTPGIGSDEED